MSFEASRERVPENGHFSRGSRNRDRRPHGRLGTIRAQGTRVSIRLDWRNLQLTGLSPGIIHQATSR